MTKFHFQVLRNGGRVSYTKENGLCCDELYFLPPSVRVCVNTDRFN